MTIVTMLGKRLVGAARKVAALVALGATALASGAAWADPPGRVGRVAEVQGTVWTLDDQQGEWVAARRNMPVTVGDRLSVQPGGRAMVQIGSGVLRVDGDSELEMVRLDDNRVSILVHAGTAALQLPLQDSAREFELVTAEGRFMPRERGHYRVDRRDGTSIVTVWDGSLRFESQDSQLDVMQGQRADFWLERGRTHYATAAMDRDAFTDWVVASERREGAIARRHVSPEMTGAYELDRYGAWDTHPQYGPVWHPHAVASDWAPYRYGHWTWVAPWGWTWVDDSPWGFAPFHYGRWVSWNGRWCWTPGTYVARPVYAPALVAWFGGPNLSVGVRIGGGAPHLGWVALAPFELYRPWYTASAVYVNTINVSPWRDVRGYRDHRHHDYVNRHVHNAFIVVPQAVLTDRRPIRQDVITPGQAQLWRGGAAPMNGIAVKLPDTSATASASNTTKNSGRSGSAFLPPAPTVVRTAAVAPAQAPGASRSVPWVTQGRGVKIDDERRTVPSDMRPGTVTASPRGVPATGAPGAPTIRGDRDDRAVAVPRGEPGRLDPGRSDVQRGEPMRGDVVRGDVVRGDVGRGEPVRGEMGRAGRVATTREADEVRAPVRVAPPPAVQAPVLAEPARPQRMPPSMRDDDDRIVRPQRGVAPPPVLRDDDDRGVRRAPPQVAAPQPAPQPRPMPDVRPMEPPRVVAPVQQAPQMPQVQPMPRPMPPIAAPQHEPPPRPQPRGRNNDDDERGGRRGGPDRGQPQAR